MYNLTELELIARQAKKIEELFDEVRDLSNRIRQAKMLMVCCSGPLNGNRLGYNRDQIRTFQEIMNELGD